MSGKTLEYGLPKEIRGRILVCLDRYDTMCHRDWPINHRCAPWNGGICPKYGNIYQNTKRTKS